MKRIITLFCFIAILMFIGKTVLAQSRYADSLKMVLSNPSKPIERFTILIAISESVGFYTSDPDSAICINLLQIAQ